MPDNLNNLDHLIDDVAREITERRVDDGFARHVSVRIQDAGAARVTRSWSRTWLLAPAAACVALVAVMIVRQVPSPNVRLKPDATKNAMTTNATADVRLKPDATAEAATAPQTATADVRLTTSAKAPAVKKPDATTDTTATASDLDVKPLAMAPIELTSLDVSPLVVAMPIEISTIAIDRIEIAAMP
jgi:hypothetical protein